MRIVRYLLVVVAAALASASAVQAAGNTQDLVLKDDAKCTTCHDENDSPKVLRIGQTRHGAVADPRVQSCTGCHGASEKHIADAEKSVKPPAIPDVALETERSVALSQLAQMRDDMMRYPVRLATEAAFGDHPYGRGVLGSDATLRAVTAADARTWHQANVLSSPCVLAVVGDVAADEVAQRLATAFTSLEYRAASPLVEPSWPAGVVSRAESRDKAQTGLAIAFRGPSRRDDARIAAHLIAGVASGLGGRFFDELRDKQSLGYTVHASSSDRLAAGMFLAYIGTSPEKEDVARAGLLREFDKLREAPVTDTELDRARTYALGTHAIAQQSGGNVLAELVDAWLYGRGLDELDQYAARLKAVTPRAMQRLARDYFDAERRVEGIVRGRQK